MLNSILSLFSLSLKCGTQTSTDTYWLFITACREIREEQTGSFRKNVKCREEERMRGRKASFNSDKRTLQSLNIRYQAFQQAFIMHLLDRENETNTIDLNLTKYTGNKIDENSFFQINQQKRQLYKFRKRRLEILVAVTPRTRVDNKFIQVNNSVCHGVETINLTLDSLNTVLLF